MLINLVQIFLSFFELFWSRYEAVMDGIAGWLELS
jgi:hypothetical protein